MKAPHQSFMVQLVYLVTYTETIIATSEEEAARKARASTPNGINREDLIRPRHEFVEARVVRDPYENPVTVVIDLQERGK